METKETSFQGGAGDFLFLFTSEFQNLPWFTIVCNRVQQTKPITFDENQDQETL